MAFFQYLNFDGVDLPLPDSYEVDMTDKEADSGGETEAGTVQRDVVRTGRRHIKTTPACCCSGMWEPASLFSPVASPTPCLTGMCLC